MKLTKNDVHIQKQATTKEQNIQQIKNQAIPYNKFNNVIKFTTKVLFLKLGRT